MISNKCPPCHWSIAEANGSESNGTCIKCGETKSFRNSIPEDGVWPTNRTVEGKALLAARRKELADSLEELEL